MHLLFLTFLVTAVASKAHQIWGPGLTPDKIIMPARYFFISLEDILDNTVSKTPQVVIGGVNTLGRPCRIWTELLDRKDHFFIVRYKLHEVCTNLNISIRLNGAHLPGSPFVTSGTVLPDDCNCPERDMETFMTSWDCGETPALVQEQVGSYGKIDWNELRQELIDAFNKPLSISLCHYVIKSNKIYRKCYGKYVDFKMFVDKALLALSRKVVLPDVEFFMNLGDWPLSSNKMSKKYPILSWCGSASHYDIILPTYEITESVLENMGRVSVNTLSVQGNVGAPWEERIPKLFWRGRDANRHRLDLIKLARENPDYINASLTNFFFYKEEEHIYGPKSEHISLYKFFDYKYQLAIDGTVAPYRTPFLLAGGSLVFKPDSQYFEYFYKDLKPNVHYIPVRKDLGDLIDKIKWAMQNDEEAKRIAINGQKFTNEKISPKDIYCYHAHVFHRFSQIVTSSVEVLEEMEEVDHEKLQKCQCHNDIKDEL